MGSLAEFILAQSRLAEMQEYQNGSVNSRDERAASPVAGLLAQQRSSDPFDTRAWRLKRCMRSRRNNFR